MNKAIKRKKKEKLLNKKLVKRYYFLKPTPWYKQKHKEKYDYSYIEWFGWPQGWNKAFGMMYLKELGEEIKCIGQKDFQILQMKEKFGQARCYTSGTSSKAHDIINKYEYLSQNICWHCGKPDVPTINDGWIYPVCFDCFYKNMRERERYHKGAPMTDDDIKNMYEKCIVDEPNANGEYRMCDSYTIKYWDKDRNECLTTYDISETANAIRQHWENREKSYKKWVSRKKTNINALVTLI